MAVIVDVAGGPVGGAARFRTELQRYLARSDRRDVRIIGEDRRLDPAWLMRRELSRPHAIRRVAVNNVSFVSPGGQRWALLRNVLHFLTDKEADRLDPGLRAAMRRQAAVVRLAAKRADAIVVPCTAMAERVRDALPAIRSRIVIRAHPVSADSIWAAPRDPAILCPVVFEPYKQMDERLGELLTAVEGSGDQSVRLRVTANRLEVPGWLAADPRIELVGRISHHDLRDVWSRSRAIYFPTGLESFGYPLAEARVSGHPVIARDTSQNREIAGRALCGFTLGDRDSLSHALKLALTTDVPPDPKPFDPDSYFDWMLGASDD